jgi:RNA polymerase-binding transcription factor
MSRDATLPRHDNPLSDQLPGYRSLLEEQWRRQVADIVELSYDLHSPVSDESDDEPRGNGLRVTARLLFAARKHLQETEAALARVDDGSYGVCGDCRGPIPPERLEILPEARYCVACQARSDSRG